MNQISYQPCDPAIEAIFFGEHEPPKVTERLKDLFAADQAARQADSIDWDRLSAEDRQRRVEVLGYLTHGELIAPESLFYAAFIFQHGNCPDHYQLAHQLAERALDAGFDQARWIFAATLDRYLLSVGQPQKYGTQFLIQEDGQWRLQPYDPSTTDAERQRYNVPPLEEQLRRRT
jgi:hypothetical protein